MSESEKKKIGLRTKKITLPVLPLRGLCVFPYMVLHFDVGREKSVAALEAAMIGDQKIFLVAQMDAQKDEPSFNDLYSFGTVAKVKQLLKLPGGSIRVLVEGLNRGKLLKLTDSGKYMSGEIRQYPNITPEITPTLEAMTRNAKEIFDEYLQIMSKTPRETIISVMNIKNPGEIADLIAANVFVNLEDKMAILEETVIEKRVEKLIVIMHREMEIVRLEKDIAEKVKEQIDKNQREYYLREQVKIIQNELGDRDGISAEVKEYKRKIAKSGIPKESASKLLADVDRLAKMPAGMSDGALLRTYLDTVLSLPWNIYTKERFNIERAKRILDRDHYGLFKVKERILEFLAVRQLAKDIKGPILCLVGPPGVGKTSIAKSIATALGKNYARLSLGGIRDEAEIRGHRKTYIGAMPGRIINAVRMAKSKNAMILLDEIDKMSNDFRGDPSSAMLEVLDSEQNFAFSDHYIEIPFDLSEILFITTANSLDSIPRPLQDRMEVITLSGYTDYEKVQIAQRYIIPKQKRLHGISSGALKIDENAIYGIVNYYTKESGVRNLERQIATICRKSARMIIEEGAKRITVNAANLDMFLGKRIYSYDLIKDNDEVGVATGLAWTAFGGDTLQIEVNIMDGKGEIVLTGSLGDVMKESAKAAISYIRSVAGQLGIDREFYKEKDIHIHVPDGATPKDGPSAGITIATALISALTGRSVRRDVAMTGEITLRGRILPIGGFKEKALAAYRAGIGTVLFPAENEKDLQEIPPEVCNKIKFVAVKSMTDVLEISLGNEISSDNFSILEGFSAGIGEGTGIRQ
ncbi:MAG: Lon protease 1 [Firmicutes bacterium ADurb.Bin193]|nr:MAG: Lon protease 1 [Firmicutes bacterium ADurb.Bin193]